MWDYLPLFYLLHNHHILFHLWCYVHGSRSCIVWKLKRFENIKSMKQLLGLSSGLCTIWILCVMKMEHSQTIWFCRDSFFWPCYFEKTWLLYQYAWSIIVCMSILNFSFESYGSEHSCHNKEVTRTNMLGSIPHKNSFLSLPYSRTRRR